MSHSFMEATWKEIQSLQQQQQQQDQTQQQHYPSSQRAFALDPSYTSFLSPSPPAARGYPTPASKVATPSAMNTSYNSNISGGVNPMAYSSPFAARGRSAASPGASATLPEWQEYRLSPSVSFRGDRPMYGSHFQHQRHTYTYPHPTVADLPAERRSSHDLRTVSVQNALGIKRDGVPDDWVEALKELVGKHLRTQLKMYVY